jgi:hypothetical protein
MKRGRTKAPSLQDLLRLYECEPVKFSGDPYQVEHPDSWLRRPDP